MIQTTKEINTHDNFRMSPESIAKSLEHIHLDGSSWIINNWQKEWRILKYDLINAIKYDCNWQKISSNEKAIAQVKNGQVKFQHGRLSSTPTMLQCFRNASDNLKDYIYAKWIKNTVKQLLAYLIMRRKMNCIIVLYNLIVLSMVSLDCAV